MFINILVTDVMNYLEVNSPNDYSPETCRGKMVPGLAIAMEMTNEYNFS